MGSGQTCHCGICAHDLFSFFGDWGSYAICPLLKGFSANQGAFMVEII